MKSQDNFDVVNWASTLPPQPDEYAPPVVLVCTRQNCHILIGVIVSIDVFLANCAEIAVFSVQLLVADKSGQFFLAHSSGSHWPVLLLLMNLSIP
ncbi:MAG: hypothetical protein EZS28_030902 [Streblomastix strix]|uniref:Uncharacterized protein n=1 Tax=Streblomastix strix TaxID=222440 RepID=A0A5J4UUG5_9EUKA|nr:MAG: hypothetical protein EZS28_030902 [Streblomastix strix]